MRSALGFILTAIIINSYGHLYSQPAPALEWVQVSAVYSQQNMEQIDKNDYSTKLGHGGTKWDIYTRERGYGLNPMVTLNGIQLQRTGIYPTIIRGVRGMIYKWTYSGQYISGGTIVFSDLPFNSSDYKTHVLQVLAYNPPPKPKPNATIGLNLPNPPYIQSNTIYNDVASVPPQDGFNYDWSISGARGDEFVMDFNRNGNIITNLNINISGTFVLKCTVTDTKTGDKDTKTTTIKVVPPPVVTSFSVTPNPLISGGNATLTPVFNNSYGESALVDQGIGLVTSGKGVPTGNLGVARTYTIFAQNLAYFSTSLQTTVSIEGMPGAKLTGSLGIGRTCHASVVLKDGRVLVTGGLDSGMQFLPSAEIYDPALGIFSTTGTMLAARGLHTMTLLKNGKVLIVGGRDAGRLITAAELYDPATGVFSSAGELTTGRLYHTATLLNDGRVLIVGGVKTDDSLVSSAEIYDPATGKFTATGAMSLGRGGHTATVLQDGSVLIAGGNDASLNAELYQPNNGSFAAVGPMNMNRSLHTATGLKNGKVLFVGGRGLGNAEWYDPNTKKFTATGATIITGRVNHTATLLPNGKVVVIGGTGYQNFTNFDLSTAEIFDPNVGTFSEYGGLNVSRYSHTCNLLSNGKILVVGGSTGLGSTATGMKGTAAVSELFEPNSKNMFADDFE